MGSGQGSSVSSFGYQPITMHNIPNWRAVGFLLAVLRSFLLYHRSQWLEYAGFLPDGFLLWLLI